MPACTRRGASTDPLTAAQWAESIGNDNLRNSQIESIASAWLKTDANRASAWIATTNREAPRHRPQRGRCKLARDHQTAPGVRVQISGDGAGPLRVSAGFHFTRALPHPVRL